MFIQTEETPNPSALKFIPDGREILSNGTLEFKNQKQAATSSPLALQLFEISGVESIFFGKDFLTITKKNDATWLKLKPEIQAIIMDFFVSERPIFYAKNEPEQGQKNESQSPINAKGDEKDGEEDSEIVKQIKELIEIKVRPAVAMDGGDITFHSFEDGIVKLVLKGSCSGCPSSTITLKNGIENMLKHYIPEVEMVEQVMEE